VITFEPLLLTHESNNFSFHDLISIDFIAYRLNSTENAYSRKMIKLLVLVVFLLGTKSNGKSRNCCSKRNEKRKLIRTENGINQTSGNLFFQSSYEYNLQIPPPGGSSRPGKNSSTQTSTVDDALQQNFTLKGHSSKISASERLIAPSTTAAIIGAVVTASVIMGVLAILFIAW
jgi:hypothetical protein